MNLKELINEIDRRGVLKAFGATAASAALSTPDDAEAKDIVKKEPATNNNTAATTPEKLKAVLIAQAKKIGIKGAELAQLVSQADHETGNFVHMIELGDANHFKKYDPRHNPAKAKSLGNVSPGDGERYKGRGFLQITGKTNYENATEYLQTQGMHVDLVKNPNLLATNPHVNAIASLHYWMTRVKPNVKNFNDVKQVTKTINPGMQGLKNRIKNFATSKAELLKGKRI